MKTLYIIRHGKSSWEFNVPDDERPLIKKGIKRTHKIADFLVEKETKADLLISSHANRALSTAKIIAGVLDYAEEDIHGSVGITYQSKYIWRGFDVFNDKSAIQPEIDLDLFGVCPR